MIAIALQPTAALAPYRHSSSINMCPVRGPRHLDRPIDGSLLALRMYVHPTGGIPQRGTPLDAAIGDGDGAVGGYVGEKVGKAGALRGATPVTPGDNGEFKPGRIFGLIDGVVGERSVFEVGLECG